MVDIFMPGMCGLDTIEQIRRGSSTPIIAMSGFRLRNPAASVDYLGMAALKGATVTIRKPFNAGQLINAVEWIRSMQGHTGGSVH